MPRDMPTAAKLVGALSYGAIGGAAAVQGVPTLPPEVVPGYLVPLSAIMGLWCGWSMIGRSKPGSVSVTLTQSVVTLGVMVVAVLLAVSCWDMVARSMRLRYDGPGEAVLDVANLFVGYGQLMLVPPVLTVLALGAVIGAALVAFAARVWR